MVEVAKKSTQKIPKAKIKQFESHDDSGVLPRGLAVFVKNGAETTVQPGI